VKKYILIHIHLSFLGEMPKEVSNGLELKEGEEILADVGANPF